MQTLPCKAITLVLDDVFGFWIWDNICTNEVVPSLLSWSYLNYSIEIIGVI